MQTMTSMGSKTREYTTLPVRTETLRRLRGYRVGAPRDDDGVSYHWHLEITPQLT